MRKVSLSMGSLGKTFALVLVILFLMSLVFLSQMKVKAESTEPSPPNFTIQISNSSTIQLVIENQAFTNTSSVNSLVYYCRFKDHNSDSWIKDGDYTLQSNSDTTIISIPPIPGMPSILSTTLLENSSLLDFQVQAVTGFYNVTWIPGYMPDAPTQFQSGNGYEDITFNPVESSNWSTTQTITLPSSSNSGTQTSAPSALASLQSPTSDPIVPELSWLAVIPLIVGLFFVAVMLRHRKPKASDGKNLSRH